MDHPDTQADLAIESYAKYKDHWGSGYTMLHITIHYIY